MRREKRIFGVVATLVASFLLVVLYRVYNIQILRHEELDRYSSSSEIVRTVKGRRGTIFDRNGEVIAISEPRIDLAVDPNGVKDKKSMAALLAKAADLDSSKVLRTLEKRSNFRYLKKDVPYDTVRTLQEAREKAVSRLRELERRRGMAEEDETERKRLGRFVADLDNVVLVDGYKRVYPQGKLLANVLGWVSRNGGEGLGGIELAFNKYLSGGEIKVKRLYIPGSGEGALEVEKEMEGARAGDLHLTVDAAIQAIAEEELDKMVAKSKAKWGGVVAMDPTTGRILAIANNPTFFPEEYFRYPLDRRRNRVVADLFEPGSTIKIFSLLAAMNENVVRPGERIKGHNGRFRFGGRFIRDHEGKDSLTLEDIVIHSSNIGTVQIVDRLSSETLFRYLSSFGFGVRSGVQLPGESTLPIRAYEKWYPIDKANISFGQGFAANMVQMARAMTVLFNGGVLWQPTIVDRVLDPVTGRALYESLPSLNRMEFRYGVDKKMIAMMERVVKEGTAQQATLRGVSVAGKTGTSQKYDRKKKRYSMEDETCSFIGAVPADNPKLVMMVLIDEPQGREYGGTVAAPVFREIARRVLPMFGVYVEREAKEVPAIPEIAASDVTMPLTGTSGADASSIDVVMVPPVEGTPLSRAVYVINQAGLDVVASGNAGAIVRRQSPPANDVVPYGTTVIIETDEAREDPEQTEGGE